VCETALIAAGPCEHCKGHITQLIVERKLIIVLSLLRTKALMLSQLVHACKAG